MRIGPSLSDTLEQKRKFHRLIGFSMRNRGQFKIHRGVRLSRVYKSQGGCSFPLCFVPHDLKRTTCIQFDRSFQREGRLCANYRYEEIPSSQTKQTIVIVLRSRREECVNKIRLCFLPFLSPLFFFLFYLFIFSLLWFSSNSLRSTLLLRQFFPLIARFFPPVSSPPPLFQLLFFECMPFPTPSKLFTSGLRYFQPWSRDFLYLGCFNGRFYTAQFTRYVSFLALSNIPFFFFSLSSLYFPPFCLPVYIAL